MSAPLSLPVHAADDLATRAEASRIPGVSVAVVTPNGQEFVWTHGEALPSLQVTPDTPFYAASSGKHVTAAAILQLSAEGRLDLHQRIDLYLTDIPPQWADRSVWSLLHHTTGLPEYLDESIVASSPKTRAEFMVAGRSLSPHFSDREAWSYSNTNYILLGLLVCEVSGKPFGNAIQQLAFNSNGTGEGLAVGGPTWARRHAGSTDPDAWSGSDPVANTDVLAGDGDLVLSARGALAWHRKLFSEPRGALKWPLFSETIELTSTRPAQYGCGWFVDRVAGQSCLHHAGHYDGYSAFFYVLPHQRAGVYLLNNIGAGSTRAQRAIALAALEHLAPGSTPLGLSVIADGDAALTARTRCALLRSTQPIDPSAFAPELLTVFTKVAGKRGGMNLWTGEEPSEFSLVEEGDGEPMMRRYRLRYANSVEHVSVGYAPDGKIYWAWPL